jgi:hypothetical protein
MASGSGPEHEGVMAFHRFKAAPAPLAHSAGRCARPLSGFADIVGPQSPDATCGLPPVRHCSLPKPCDAGASRGLAARFNLPL